MKRRGWSVALCIVALIGAMACSSDDDPINSDLPVPTQAEAAIESALEDVVVPVGELLDGLEDLINGLKAPALECPNTAGVCSSGTLTCDADSDGLDFNFDSCNVVTVGSVVDGGVSFAPTGLSSFLLTFTGLSIDGGNSLSGTLALDEQSCTENWALATTDGVGVLGTIVGCGEYPEANSLFTITVTIPPDFWRFAFSFDGSSTAGVFVELNEDGVAACDLNLSTLQADCSGL